MGLITESNRNEPYYRIGPDCAGRAVVAAIAVFYYSAFFLVQYILYGVLAPSKTSTNTPRNSLPFISNKA